MFIILLFICVIGILIWITPKKQEEIHKPTNPLKEQAEKILIKLKTNDRSQWITKNLDIIIDAISEICNDTKWKLVDDILTKLEMNQQFKVLESTVDKGKKQYKMEVFCNARHIKAEMKPSDSLKIVISSDKTNYQKTIYFGTFFSEKEIRNFYINN
ncbi:hypothetical protein [Chryseobacterium sp. CCH4-E10]|uniref:hypothetical protein n=1 Tax=Chryseobacterium sp. CCH4-E10 TaxID=1768758 RepID=UPI00082E447C|nr:hypothetical protein [Chryseobacterium sp. CCH4-E10]